MPILTIKHVTTYHYKQPVAFGEHRMMLRPRDDDDQKVLESELEITPEPIRLTWTQDMFGNHVATARFADRASELRFESTIRVDHAAGRLPRCRYRGFRPNPSLCLRGERQARPRALHHAGCGAPRARSLGRRASSATDGSADTRELLVDMTQTIRRTFKHVARHEKGTQDPIQTLKLASGSCRDLAVLMIAALRSLGIAARFVSGYLHLADDDDDHHRRQHPCLGPGLRSRPRLGRLRSVERHGRESEPRSRRGRAPKPREAIPLQGTWIGDASDHLAMKVAVKVMAASADAGCEAQGFGRWRRQAGTFSSLIYFRPRSGAGKGVFDENSRGLRNLLRLPAADAHDPDAERPSFARSRPADSGSLASSILLSRPPYITTGFGNLCHVIRAPRAG